MKGRGGEEGWGLVSKKLNKKASFFFRSSSIKLLDIACRLRRTKEDSWSSDAVHALPAIRGLLVGKKNEEFLSERVLPRNSRPSSDLAGGGFGSRSRWTDCGSVKICFFLG